MNKIAVTVSILCICALAAVSGILIINYAGTIGLMSSPEFFSTDNQIQDKDPENSLSQSTPTSTAVSTISDDASKEVQNHPTSEPTAVQTSAPTINPTPIPTAVQTSAPAINPTSISTIDALTQEGIDKAAGKWHGTKTMMFGMATGDFNAEFNNDMTVTITGKIDSPIYTGDINAAGSWKYIGGDKFIFYSGENESEFSYEGDKLSFTVNPSILDPKYPNLDIPLEMYRA